MADTNTTFTAGYDYTTTFGGFAAALNQGITQALPNALRGLVYYNEAQPSTTGQPTGYPTNWYAFNLRGLWVKPSTGETYSYKSGVGFTNVATLIPNNTITTAMLQNSSVTVSKLSSLGGAAGQSLLVNATGTAMEFGNPVANIATGSFPVNKLVPGTSLQFLQTVGGNVQWSTLTGADINTLLSVTRLEPTYIQPGLPLQVMATDPTANYSQWTDITTVIQQNSLPYSVLNVGTGNASKLLGVNSAGTGWEFVSTPATTVFSKSWTSALLTLTDQTVAHTSGPTPITTVPVLTYSVLVCNTGEFGYTAGDEVPMEYTSCNYTSGDDNGPWCSITADATNFVIKTYSPLSGAVQLIRKDTGALTGIDNANWRIKIYAFAP